MSNILINLLIMNKKFYKKKNCKKNYLKKKLAF